MKEEIYLLFKNVLSPRLNYLKRYFLWWFAFKFGRNPPKKIKYFFVGDKRDCGFSLDEKKFDFLFVSEDDLSFLNLDPKFVYVLLNDSWDLLNYLRGKGLVVIMGWKFVNNLSEKPFWQRRLSIVEAIYADLVLEGIDASLLDLSSRDEWTDFEKDVFNGYLLNKGQYEEFLNGYLKDGWSLRRINFMAVAVLFEAVSEIYAKKTPVNVLIEQSVKTAKNYCGDDEYKLVNGLLNNCLRDIDVLMNK